MTGKIIVITGPKHSGKTSAGKALARLGGGRFVDLDALVEARAGKTPRALFREGPEVFRKAEAESLAAVLTAHAAEQMATGEAVPAGEGDLVVAAGGGLIDNEKAVELLKSAGQTAIVYLDVTVETAWRRISAGGELPPFLNTGNPEATHRALHERRAAAYRELARIAIDGENKSPDKIAREIAYKIVHEMT